MDHPGNSIKFESFLNTAEQDQENILAWLANQDRLFMAFYGDDLEYRFTKVILIPRSSDSRSMKL